MGSTKDQGLVIERDDNTLVCALPGSGKTYVLVELTKRLLSRDGAYSVHLLTFTDAARVELTERMLHALTPRAMERVTISTFHSTALAMTRGKLNRRLLMANELMLFVKSVLNEADHLDLIDKFRFKVPDVVRLFDEMGRSQDLSKEYSDTEVALYELYKDMLIKQGKTDFNVVCQLSVSWLAQREIPPVSATHILVDEFQDTDALQYMWLREHALLGKKLVVVGDDDQAIYSFRGGQGYDNMVAFQSEFNADAYVLRDCFRCSKEILNRAGMLIKFNNPDRIDKPMNAVREEQGTVKIIKSGTMDNQLNRILDAVSKEPHTWAVIARNNAILDRVETVIQGHGIEYNRRGGKSFFDGVAPYSLIQIASVISGKHDDHTLHRALAALSVPEAETARIIGLCRTAKTTFGGLKHAEIGHHADLQKFHSLAEGWHDIPAGREDAKRTYMQSIVKLLVIHLDKRDQKHAQVVGDVIAGRHWESLGESIAQLKSSLDSKKRKDQSEEAAPKLSLITMHSSKGLQFDNVWIVGSDTGTIPSKEALAGGKIAEERRLMYVAMTRAISSLTMSYTSEPSEFLYEVNNKRVVELESGYEDDDDDFDAA